MDSFLKGKHKDTTQLVGGSPHVGNAHTHTHVHYINIDNFTYAGDWRILKREHWIVHMGLFPNEGPRAKSPVSVCFPSTPSQRVPTPLQKRAPTPKGYPETRGQDTLS